MLHPAKNPKTPYITKVLDGAKGVFVAASDYTKTLPESISSWVPGPLFSLGTDGFGRSDGRKHLRNYFEVDEKFIVLATLYSLYREGQFQLKDVKKAMQDLNIDPDKANPMLA
jgi:pyruvate dehydrogenase E1 component